MKHEAKKKVSSGQKKEGRAKKKVGLPKTRYSSTSSVIHKTICVEKAARRDWKNTRHTVIYTTLSLYLSGAMSFLYGCAPVEGPYVEFYELYVQQKNMYIIVLEVRQVDLLALGALQQPFLPLLFLECALLAPCDNLPCNDGDDDDAWCYL
jgi:hypothetical protein